MTSTTLAQKTSSLPTTPSTSPVIKRFGSAYALVNPGTNADNVMAIVEHVIYAPLPADYTEISDVVRKSKMNPSRAEALTRARQRLATQVEEISQKTTIASLRLKSGLSQTEVAELLGNSQSSYSMIESGRRGDIFHSTFEKLVGIFGVSRDKLAEAIINTQEKIS